MTMVFTKYEAKQLSEHLNTREVDCQCDYNHCEHTVLDVNVVERFEELRLSLGNLALNISSGFRCGKHNYEEGGVPLSRHKLGQAIDITCPEDMQFEYFEKRCKAIFPFVLSYKALRFCHCDVDKR